MGTRESLVPALAAAISGLLGVVVGAVVAGQYQLESQRIASQQSENAAQYETSRLAAQSLIKGAAEYLTELAYLATFAKTPEKIKNLDRTHADALSLRFRTLIADDYSDGAKKLSIQTFTLVRSWRRPMSRTS